MGPKQALGHADWRHNGFEVSVAVSSRPKTSALAGDCLGMITPGFAFALAVEIFQEGKESAQKLAIETAEQIKTRLVEYGGS